MQGSKDKFVRKDSRTKQKIKSEIEFDGQITGDLIPSKNEVYNLGSSTKRWNDAFLNVKSL